MDKTFDDGIRVFGIHFRELIERVLNAPGMDIQKPNALIGGCCEFLSQNQPCGIRAEARGQGGGIEFLVIYLVF